MKLQLWRKRERKLDLHIPEATPITTHSQCTTHTQDSPGGVVEKETGETELLVHGSDVEDAMIAVEGERRQDYEQTNTVRMQLNTSN